VQANRGWLVNLLTVFARHSFLHPMVRRLGATPLSVLLDALLMFVSPSHSGCLIDVPSMPAGREPWAKSTFALVRSVDADRLGRRRSIA